MFSKEETVRCTHGVTNPKILRFWDMTVAANGENVLRRQLASGAHPGVKRLPVVDGVVVLQGRVERSRLIPPLVRAVHAVEGVVPVEDRLTSDVDDRDADPEMTYLFMRVRT